jgi:diadenylate cyclase
MLLDRAERLFERLASYPLGQVALELLIIALVIYMIIRFVQGTRAAGALKGTLILIVIATILIRVLGHSEAFARLKFIYEHFLTLLAIALIVVFQPELRRGLIRLGEAPLLRRGVAASDGVPSAIAEAASYLSRNKFGAIIVLQREAPLKGLVEGGTSINGRASARLLQALFFPGAALHDLAVIIHRGEILAAGVQLPLADPEDMPDPSLGSRHRAAVGLTRECDALAVVVSEETGTISIAERGRLDRHLTVDELRGELEKRLRLHDRRPVSAVAALNGREGDSDGTARHDLHDLAHPDDQAHDASHDSVAAMDLRDPRD